MKYRRGKKSYNSDEKKHARISGRMARGVKNPLWYGLGSRLKAVLDASGKSYVELERASGVPDSTIRQVETGKRLPGINTIERIAAALGVSPCWLAFGDDGANTFQARIPRQGRMSNVASSQGPDEFESHFAGCAARLCNRRAEFGLSLRQLAEASKVSHQTIMKIEKGRQVPRLDVAHRLALSLDVAPCWLAFGVGTEPSPVHRESVGLT